MAWRPNDYFLDGELNSTIPGKVTGWMRFAGMQNKVTFELEGDFHRDIRGATIRFRGDGREDNSKAESYMEGFAERQTGQVGDITAGRPPQDYVDYPYIEWYSEQNGRVVIELEPDQIIVIGTPIPACESDAVSREEQNRNMADFLAGLSQGVGVPAVAGGAGHPIASDPRFTHWVTERGQIVGEAHSAEPGSNGVSSAFVRLFAMPEMAEYGTIESAKLCGKNAQA